MASQGATSRTSRCARTRSSEGWRQPRLCPLTPVSLPHSLTRHQDSLNDRKDSSPPTPTLASTETEQAIAPPAHPPCRGYWPVPPAPLPASRGCPGSCSAATALAGGTTYAVSTQPPLCAMQAIQLRAGSGRELDVHNLVSKRLGASTTRSRSPLMTRCHQPVHSLCTAYPLLTITRCHDSLLPCAR